MTDDLHRSELYRAFIGEGRTDYYLKRFAAFDEQGGGFYRSWNWAAFFVGPLWAVFRKMHSVYWLFGLIAVFGVVMLRFSAAHYFLLLGLTWLVLTLYANALYYRHAKRMISRAQAKGLAGQDLLSHLESAGDVDYANSAAGVFLIAGLTGATVIAIGVFSHRAETAAVYGLVDEGIESANLVKTASAKFASRMGRWPRSNAEIGMPLRLASYPRHVDRIEVQESGVVMISFSEPTGNADCERCAAIENQTITLAPQVQDGVVLWTCASQGLHIPCLRPNVDATYLSDMCRCQEN